MTNSVSLTLQGVSYQLPDGRPLFSGLNGQFDLRPTGLVGRNGVGKSVLARILAGQLAPTSGRCLRVGSVHYLAQQISPKPGHTVADLAGVKDIMDALERIERGSTVLQDFDAVGDRWDIQQQLRHLLEAQRLDRLKANTPVTQLSGGEVMRVSLMGALLSGAEMLILDEPTNHLDRDNRQALREQLRDWPGALIVISHDRELLEAMSRIVELSSLGLRSYGGGYSFYAQTKNQERAQALAQLELRKIERRREERALAEQRERLDRRGSRGARQAEHANQAPILLGRQKERSEVSCGKLRAQREETRDALSLRIREAAKQVEDETAVVLFTPDNAPSQVDKIAELTGVVLPYLPGGRPGLDLSMHSAQRIGLVGPNGSGKSILLKILAGRLAPLSGRCEVFVETAYLDQHLSILDAGRSILDQMLAANAGTPDSTIRTRLALLGLNADRALLPVCQLSGGEKLKAALALVLYADRPAQLLLLDEPTNHLDLASAQALEAMLQQYRGALVVVSHDEVFLESIALTHRLQLSHDGGSTVTCRTVELERSPSR